MNERQLEILRELGVRIEKRYAMRSSWRACRKCLVGLEGEVYRVNVKNIRYGGRLYHAECVRHSPSVRRLLKVRGRLAEFDAAEVNDARL